MCEDKITNYCSNYLALSRKFYKWKFGEDYRFILLFYR